MSKKEKNKIYMKAIHYYNNGEIEKAMTKCEEGISNNLNNGSILNLKGLLLYLKGDLRGAVITWKINSDFNDDGIAKNYIEDSKVDKERLQIYKEGETFLKKMLVDEAIEKFKGCQESDFNSINVNSSLALCYMKKGEYTLASVHLVKVLEIDKNNVVATKMAKELKEFAGIELEVKRDGGIRRKLLVAIILIVAVSGGIIGYKETYNRSENKTVENVVDKQKDIPEEIVDKEKVETKKDILIDIESVESAIVNQDYETLYNIINPIVEVSNLTEKEKATYYKGNETLEVKGTEFFYKKATALFKVEKYELAKIELLKSYKYGEKSYLYPHEMFYLGAVNEKLQDSKGAINYYETYYNNYKEGPYIESIIYSLALLYKQEDLVKSKKYANELITKYPKSIYNNEIISNLSK